MGPVFYESFCFAKFSTLPPKGAYYFHTVNFYCDHNKSSRTVIEFIPKTTSPFFSSTAKIKCVVKHCLHSLVAGCESQLSVDHTSNGVLSNVFFSACMVKRNQQSSSSKTKKTLILILKINLNCIIISLPGILQFHSLLKGRLQRMDLVIGKAFLLDEVLQSTFIVGSSSVIAHHTWDMTV